MKNLLAFDFWFNYDFVPLLAIFQKIFIASVVLFLVLTIVFGFLARRKNLYAAINLNVYYFSLTNTIVGLFLLFFYFEQVPFFSARVWLLLWVIEIILWFIAIIIRLVKIPQERRARQEKQAYNKYLPK